MILHQYKQAESILKKKTNHLFLYQAKYISNFLNHSYFLYASSETVVELYKNYFGLKRLVCVSEQDMRDFFLKCKFT